MREKLIEQRKKKIKKWFYIFLTVVIFGLILFARFFIPSYFKNLSVFSLKNIVIEPADYSSFIKDYISLPEKTNILSINMSEIYSRIKKIYFVEDCVIEKHLPDTLIIRLKIRNPWVVVVDERSAAIMDRNGYFLPLVKDFKGWVVEGIKPESAGARLEEQEKLMILKEIEQWYNYYGVAGLFKIDAISLLDLDRIELKSEDKRIYIRGTEIDKQLAVAKEVLNGCKKNNLLFEYVDVRFKDPYIKEKEYQKQ
ncbi:MAG: FtsQ-type POTRA domain-containing protein [Candidatus Omnitrophica bacterium]|nr:FtsQ-type POTRA domain-containing protein [Candidatus Omnitrophota bacterium]MCM8788526.1 FtsQ-type POTRA domain-containing protein [Candidatus Omnitrophota bacterium]